MLLFVVAEKARECVEVDVVAGRDGAVAERQHRLLAHTACLVLVLIRHQYTVLFTIITILSQSLLLAI